MKWVDMNTEQRCEAINQAHAGRMSCINFARNMETKSGIVTSFLRNRGMMWGERHHMTGTERTYSDFARLTTGGKIDALADAFSTGTTKSDFAYQHSVTELSLSEFLKNHSIAWMTRLQFEEYGSVLTPSAQSDNNALKALMRAHPERARYVLGSRPTEFRMEGIRIVNDPPVHSQYGCHPDDIPESDFGVPQTITVATFAYSKEV